MVVGWSLVGWLVVWVGGWLDGWVDGQMDGLMDEWMDTNKWMGGHMHASMYVSWALQAME